MIVVDTNTIAYLYLPTNDTPDVEKLLAREPEWAAPLLWRSEFRNILALYLRKGLVDFETACLMQRQAEALMAGGEYEVDSLSVLANAEESHCSAYDCEFVALAKSLNTTLVTADRKLLKAFPGLASTARAYIASR
ncbi:type II toxin-antitoxin system VapC family toxin [Salinisphaera sp. P385]|uniref:Type II toxin-antitoxin system VapC family toxin n=1 Tax=Spectribacter acetivorans TaxID=3075603 RepID=A0ABU3B970_9GAMM|nr:type II toxin-antitoxin system VapC family toxin [Salinisphaera sp. P385]MDT0617521.1 type II toxin-antitoxin system VapC family toxin [Salinisphaera sp. P385]